jgi:transposase
VTEQGYKVAEAARSLDINDNQLRRWRQELTEEASSSDLTADEREELKRLRKEVRNLRMEKEILKKASAYFAKEMK